MANNEVYYSPDDCEYDLASVDDTTDEDGDWEFGTQPTYENQEEETTPNFKTGEEYYAIAKENQQGNGGPDQVVIAGFDVTDPAMLMALLDERIYVITRESKASTTEIPEEYSKYSKLFSDELETGLPEHSRWDHEIKLQPGTEPTFNKIYPQNPEQDAALEEYLEEMLRKGYIRPSESPAGHPVLWVPKKNGKLRPCIDYRPLNKITIKNRYPLPLMIEIRDKVGKARWFTTLDLKGAYNLIRMKEGHEWMTAFRTTRGHYEYLVMPFGLTNAPATFQTMIDTVLRKQIGVFVVVYLDDILIYSNTLEEHKQHVHEVLQTLQDNKLLVEAAKCKFHQSSVQFLGFIITHGEVQMCQDKIIAIKEWPTPTNVRDVRAFTAFVNFYRKFLKGYGDVSRPLTDLTKKDVEFKWTEKEEKSFTTIKELVTQEPVMKTPDPERPYEVETDASDYALGGQLGQRDDEGRLHPVAFFSQKLHGPELNYGIHDKELMAIIQCFKEWRHYLVGAKHKIKVYTDHKNLTSFLTTKDLNKRQIRWYETLTDYDFEIIYRKGSENGRADALSRREDLKSEEQVDNAPLLRATKDGNLVLGTREIDITWQLAERMLTPDSPVFVDKTESRRSLAELPSVVRGHNMQTGQLDTVYTAQSALAVTGGSGDPSLSVLQRMTDHLKKSLADFNEIQSPQVLYEQNVARINCILQRRFQRLREQRPEDALSIENEIIQYVVERNSLEINGLRIAEDAWKDQVAALFQALSDRLVATLQPSYFQQSLQKLAAGILEPCLLNDPEQATVKEVRDSASVGSCHEINHPAVSANGQVGLLHDADESASRKREWYDQEERAEPNKKGRSSSAVASLCQDHSDDEESSFVIVRPDRVVEASTSPRGEVAHDEQDGIHGTVVLKIIDSDGSHKGDLRQVGVWGAKRVDSILQNPVKRPVRLRKGRTFTQVHLNGICENGVKIVSSAVLVCGG
ncbi:hypothetical protein V2A60_008681 [Cordyceps javanica]